MAWFSPLKALTERFGNRGTNAASQRLQNFGSDLSKISGEDFGNSGPGKRTGNVTRETVKRLRCVWTKGANKNRVYKLFYRTRKTQVWKANT